MLYCKLGELGAMTRQHSEVGRNLGEHVVGFSFSKSETNQVAASTPSNTSGLAKPLETRRPATSGSSPGIAFGLVPLGDLHESDGFLLLLADVELPAQQAGG